jgi:NDP-sugar pyrophosphorylase family protein
MEAMIFAAGLGTRLAPLTDRLPKALIPVSGRPLLGHVMDRVAAAGATRIVVNTSRFGEQIESWLAENAPSGVEIVLSHEPDGPYDTGGGLIHAAHLFREDGPILLHNVDVLSRIPLDALLEDHNAARRRLGDKLLGTLAVQQRATSRRLLFDDRGLVGWVRHNWNGSSSETMRVRGARGPERDLAFAGIHVIEPELLRLTQRTGAFQIRDLYLDLAARGYVIQPADVSRHEWLDAGTPERLAEAETLWNRGSGW